MDRAAIERPEELLADALWLRRLASALVADAEAADDLAQSTWVAALERGPWPAKRSWLTAVARKLAKRQRRPAARARAREAQAARHEALDPAADLCARAAVHRDLVDRVMALQQPLRTALLMRYLDDLPPREIARRLDVPVRTVGSRLRRGLELLREDLDQRSGGREAWLPGIAALAGSEAWSGGSVLGGIAMGTASKAAIATALGALAVTGIAAGVHELARDEQTVREPAQIASAGEAFEQNALAVAPADDTRVPAAGEERDHATTAVRTALRLHGTVIDGGNEELALAPAPARGGRVLAWVGREAFDGRPGFASPAGEATIVDGTFELTLEDPGYSPVHVYALAEGTGAHRSATARALIAADAHDATLEFLRVHDGVLHGIVLDESGASVPGVRVLGLGRPPAQDVETATDANGAFQLVPAGVLERLDVDAPKLAVFSAPRPTPRDGGGYDDVEIVVARAGRLIVRVRGFADRPVAEADVSVELAPEEQPPASGTAFESAPRSTKTDAAGVAELAPVWIGRKMRVGILSTETLRVYYDKLDSARLLREDEPEGAALVLPPEGILELELRLDPVILVRGVVKLPDGSPVAHPAFEIEEAGREGWEARLVGGTGDEHGRFEARVSRAQSRGKIELLAADGSLASGWGATRPISHASRVMLDLDAAGPAASSNAFAVLEVEIVLAPTHAIEGLIVDESGASLSQGFGNRVYAVPAGSPYPHTPTALGREASATARKGAFRIDGLPDGVYDVYATSEHEQHFASFSTGFVRVPNVPAGTSGLEIVVPRKGGVHVRLRLLAEDPPASAIVLVGAAQRRDAPAIPASTPATITARALSSWPEGAPWNFTGGAGQQTEVGREQFALYSVDAPDGHAIAELAEGWYRFCVRPERVGDGLSHFPIATELVYLRPGDYEVRFELTPAAELAGKLAADAPVAHLALQLVDARGRALLQERGERRPMFARLSKCVPVAADGRFRFRSAPVGTHKLRIGTRAELERGEFQHEVEIEVLPADAPERPPVVIQL